MLYFNNIYFFPLEGAVEQYKMLGIWMEIVKYLLKHCEYIQNMLYKI